MLSRQSRLLRTVPSSSSRLFPSATSTSGTKRYRSTTSGSASASASASSSRIHTSSTQNAPALPSVKKETGMTLEAKERVRAHVRNIQSSAITGASPAVRPAPAQHFQPPPASKTLPKETPTFESQDGSQIKNGLDYSFVGLSGGQIFHEMMLRHDVKQVFGYPGGAILPVFDAIYNSPHFDFVLPRHEQGAGHMAEGYARVSGKPGVVLVTSGPGATNVITPMQDALSDGVPMVVFCGQVATNLIGSDAFQEADMVGISRSCTKWNVMVNDIAELPRRINEAFKIATTGRPGPVLVDLPKDVTAAILRKPIPAKSIQPGLSPYLPSTPLNPANSTGPVSGDASLIAAAAKMINGAKRPIVYAGNGVLSSPDGPRLLKELSDKGQIPVTTTLQGLGAFDERDDKSLHMIGMHGAAYANFAIQEADVVIALGARFDDRVTGKVDTFAPAARAAALAGTGGIIHFEIQPKNINKIIEANLPVLGDVVASLEKLVPQIESVDRSAWTGRCKATKERYPFTYKGSEEGQKLKPQEVVKELNIQAEAMGKEKFVIATGVGQHQMWACQYYRWTHPRTWVSSGGLGTMGFGLPSAIGAKVAAPEKVVVDIDGDASFSMTAMELATASQYNIGVKVLLFNNEFQGMVEQWQDLFYENRYSHTRMTNPDFVKLSESMGAKALRCMSIKDLPAMMKEFLEYDGTRPIVMECIVSSEHVYPMVPAGKALHEQILHPLLRNKTD
ncbi:acetolactate synthase, mitochondrial [Kwoniella sp. CBS 6097]